MRHPELGDPEMPPGVSASDIDKGDPEPALCDGCGMEFDPSELDNGLCSECGREE